jgi:rubrerythrin
MQVTEGGPQMTSKRTRVLGATAVAIAGTLTLGLAGDAMARQGSGNGGSAPDRLRDRSGPAVQSQAGNQWRAGERVAAGPAPQATRIQARAQTCAEECTGAQQGPRTPQGPADQQGPANQAGPGARGAPARGTSGPDAAVTPELEAMMQDALADEVAAMTTYEVFLDELGNVRPFTSLARSEATHVAAIERVADRLGIELDEVTPPAVAAPASLDEACAAAVAIEEADIALYDALLPELQDWPSVVRLFTNLEAASERHLDAAIACG